jgi:hypothetical protein
MKKDKETKLYIIQKFENLILVTHKAYVIEDKKNKIKKIFDYISINIDFVNEYYSFKKQIVDKISEWSINGCLHAKEIAAEYFYLIEKLNIYIYKN